MKGFKRSGTSYFWRQDAEEEACLLQKMLCNMLFGEIARHIDGTFPLLGQAKYLPTSPFTPNSYLHPPSVMPTDNLALTG